MEEFPRLAPATIEEALGERAEPAEKADVLAKAKPPEDEIDDAEAEARLAIAVERLHDLREEHANEDEDEDELPDEHFYWRILGGRWTAKHKHIPADQATMYARAHAKQWCQLFQWSSQKGFMFSMYGQEEAIYLAKAWARKANYFCKLWYDAGATEDFVYSEEQLNSYTESASFLDWAVTVEVDSVTFDRVVAVRHALPQKRT